MAPRKGIGSKESRLSFCIVENYFLNKNTVISSELSLGNVTDEGRQK